MLAGCWSVAVGYLHLQSTILIVLYCRMSVILWLRQIPGNPDEERDKEILKQKKKSVKLMASVVTAFGICWLPWHLFHSLRLLCPSFLRYEMDNINVVFYSFIWFIQSNCCHINSRMLYQTTI